MNISQVTTNQNYKQQNFGALKVNEKGTGYIPWTLLNEHSLKAYSFVRGSRLFSIIPTRKGSKLEKKIQQLIGKGAESIGIKQARLYRKGYQKRASAFEGTKVEF